MSDIDLLTVAALSGLEGAINAALALDPATAHKLAALEGRVVAIDIRVLPPEDLVIIPNPAYIQTFLLSAKRYGVSRMAEIVAA